MSETKPFGISPPNWKKNVTTYLASQTISLFGSSLVQYAIMWYITLETKSGLMMTISILCGFLPTLVLSPFAGVWADRYNRKTLIMLSDSLIAFSTLIMAILFILGYKAIWLLFIVLAIRAFGTAIQTPTSAALFPQMVPKEQLMKVSGINSSIQSTTMLISPMISGALMSLAPIQYIFFIDVITAIIGVCTLGFFVNVPLHQKAKVQSTLTYFEDMKIGFSYIQSHKYLMVFFMYLGIMLFLVAPPAFLTPLQTTRTFGAEVWRLTAIEIVFSLGMMFGGILMAYWGGFQNRMRTIIFSVSIMGLFTIALGIASNFWIYLLFMGIIGIAMPMYNTPATVLIQEKVEESFLGRVFGVMTMINSSMMPLGMIVFGPLADFMKIETLLIITGSLTLVECIFMYRHKSLINAGEPKPTL